MRQLLIFIFLSVCFFASGQVRTFVTDGERVTTSSLSSIGVYQDGVVYLPEQTTDTIHFTSVQPATLNQVSIVLQTLSLTDTVYLDWGEDAVVKVCGITDQTITSQYDISSKTYNIKLYGDLSKLKKFYIFAEPTVRGIKSSELAVCSGLTSLTLFNLGSSGHTINTADLVGMPLTYLSLHSLGASGHTINTADLVGMPLNYLYLSTLGTSGHTINTADLVGMELTYLRLNNLGTSGHTINTADLVGMKLTDLNLNNLGTTTCTGQISDLPTGLTTLNISACGTGISITSGTMKAWNANITLTSGYSTASVDGFLNAYAAVAPSSAKTIDLKGTGVGIANENRSSASDTAVFTLQGLLKTVQTNP